MQLVHQRTTQNLAGNHPARRPRSTPIHHFPTRQEVTHHGVGLVRDVRQFRLRPNPSNRSSRHEDGERSGTVGRLDHDVPRRHGVCRWRATRRRFGRLGRSIEQRRPKNTNFLVRIKIFCYLTSEQFSLSELVNIVWAKQDKAIRQCFTKLFGFSGVILPHIFQTNVVIVSEIWWEWKGGSTKKSKWTAIKYKKKLIYLLFASPGPRTASTLPAPSSPSARAAAAKRTTPARTQVPAAARYRHHLQPATIIYQTPQNSVQSSRTTVFTLHRVTVVQGHRPLCSLTIPL